MVVSERMRLVQGWSGRRHFVVGKPQLLLRPACPKGDAVGIDARDPPAIDAAAKRVTDNGGKIVMGPMPVPTGQWIAQFTDPQGAYFALIAAGR